MRSYLLLSRSTNLITRGNGLHANSKQSINTLFASLCDGCSPCLHIGNYTMKEAQ